jgi:ABC-2 type transport system ATP-binding protein
MTNNDYAVEVHNLIVDFGGFKAVNDVTFNVNKGEIFGFLGANGAGKTTTIRVLCGILRPTSGDVKVAGFSFAGDGANAIKSAVGYMSQKFTLYNDLSVIENLDFTAAIRQIPKQVYLERRDRLLKFIGFDRSLSTKVQDLPGGTKQQVSLVAAMIHDPQIIFLDEPTAGVTPGARKRFWNLIRELAKSGKTVFVTTHYMDEAEECGRVALMKDGKIIALDSPAKLKASAFKYPILNLTPKDGAIDVKEFKALPAFESFAAYGLNYHAVIGNYDEWTKIKDRIHSLFRVSEITPTLEDVFIHYVLGVNP